MSIATMPSTPIASRTKRFGTIAAKIGSPHQHRLGIALDTPRGTVRAGTVVYLDVQDITRHPEAEGYTKWVCKSPHCQGKHWDSKKALLAEHPDNRTLARQEETHLYLAVAEIPGQAAREAKRDDKGRELSPAVDAKPSVVLLLSDEE